MESATPAFVAAKKVYLLVLNRADLLVSQELTRLLASVSSSKEECGCRIFLAVPSAFHEHARVWMKDIEKSINGQSGTTLEILRYTTNQTVAECREQAQQLVQQLQKQFNISHIDGLVFNCHGALPGRYNVVVENRNGVSGGGVLEMVRYKVLGLMVLLEALLQHKLLKSSKLGTNEETSTPSCRVIVAGSEASRGIPGMGFPAPQFKDDTVESFISILNGSGLVTKNGNIVYGHVEAILSLYIGAMARKHPGIFFGTLSPGFTQDSLNYQLTIEKGFLNRLLMAVFLYVLHPSMVTEDKAVDFTDAAKRFLCAITGELDEGLPQFSTGALIGAPDQGISGKVFCDQSTLSDGAFLTDTTKQDLAYRALHKFLD